MGLVWKVKLKETGQWHSPKEAARIVGCCESYLRRRKAGEQVKSFHIESWTQKNDPNWPLWSAKLRRPVKCLETNQIYSSIGSASQKSQVRPSEISLCCRGLQDLAGGFHWTYADSN